MISQAWTRRLYDLLRTHCSTWVQKALHRFPWLQFAPIGLAVMAFGLTVAWGLLTVFMSPDSDSTLESPGKLAQAPSSATTNLPSESGLLALTAEPIESDPDSPAEPQPAPDRHRFQPTFKSELSETIHVPAVSEPADLATETELPVQSQPGPVAELPGMAPDDDSPVAASGEPAAGVTGELVEFESAGGHAVGSGSDPIVSRMPEEPGSPQFELVQSNDYDVQVGELVRFIVRPIDPAMGELDYSLAPNTPEGAAINDRTGMFTWRPRGSHGGQQVEITVIASCLDDPTARAEMSFTVRVAAPPGVAEIPESEVEQPDAPRLVQEWQSTGSDLEPSKDATPHAEVNVGTERPIESIESMEPDEPEPPPALFPAPAATGLRSTAEPSRLEADDQPGVQADGHPAPANSIGMQFVSVPAGTFLMGSKHLPGDVALLDPGEVKGFRDELPQHPVRISRPFLLGKTEVTVGQFRQFITTTGYRTDAERTGAYSFNPERKEFQWGRNVDWKSPGWRQSDDHPVVNVSWNDAVAFCRWLSERERRVYRLPTEAEWEYACRAGSDTNYSAGDGIDQASRVANLGSEPFRRRIRPGQGGLLLVTTDDRAQFTTPVGTFEPNGFGLFDMHGNAFEWCGDYYDSNYYGQSPLVDPAGPPSGRKRVIRGGSFFNSPFFSRSAFRNGFEPTMSLPYIGFRIVAE